MFPDDTTAEAWFAQLRWGETPTCPRCGCDNVQVGTSHPTMPYRCRNRKCRKFFSVRVGTAMQDTKLSYEAWAMAIYILETGPKGTSSMRLHRELDVTQKTAWNLAHRIREAWETKLEQFASPFEVDGTPLGGKEKNKHADKKLNARRGTVGKTAVIGVKDRETKQVQAQVFTDTTAEPLTRFVYDISDEEEQVCTDDARAYQVLKRATQETVKPAVKEFVNYMARINGTESFWAMMKRGYHGTYRQMSKKHLARYVAEFSGRHNVSEFDTIEQVRRVASGIAGMRLRYTDPMVEERYQSPEDDLPFHNIRGINLSEGSAGQRQRPGLILSRTCRRTLPMRLCAHRRRVGLEVHKVGFIGNNQALM